MSAVGLANIEQSPYSPDLNMRDPFLLTILQEHCRGQHYGSIEDMKMDVQRFLRQLSTSSFLRELENLKSHCEGVGRQSKVYITPYCFLFYLFIYSSLFLHSNIV